MNTVTAVTNTNVASSLPPSCASVSFFLKIFSHLARSKCCKLSPLVQMCLPHSLCLSFSLPVSHLPPPSHLFPAALFYHFIFSLLPTPLLSFSLSGPNLFHASCMLTLSLAGWLIHRIVCSPQVYPRKSTPAVDRLCVGVPAAEVSQMPLHL